VAPPATPQSIAAVERVVGVSLPEDLRRWWSLADGVRAMVLCLPPGCLPMSVADALAYRQLRLDLWARTGESTASHDLAGEGSLPFLDRYLPIGDDTCGGYLYVDLRDGPLRGSVGWCSGEESHEGAVWASTAQLLASVAEAMDGGVPCPYPHADLLPEPDPDFAVEWRPAR
jgi:cell wall assembly regulator SMI1